MAEVKLLEVVIGPEIPQEAGTDWTRFAWIDTKNRQIKTFNGNNWDIAADLADIFQIPSTLEDITLKGKTLISGTLILEGYDPVDAKIKTEVGILVFKNGILVKYGE